MEISWLALGVAFPAVADRISLNHALPFSGSGPELRLGTRRRLISVEPIISIEGEKVALGPICRDHVPLYERWLNDVAVAIPYFNGELVPDPREALEERYERLRKEVSFTVYERQGLRPIGLTDLYRVSQFNGTAEFGIVIGERDCWGKGYGTEATRLVLDWGFHAMGLNNIQLKVFSYNERAIRAYLRAGFREIGRRRQAKRVGQHLYDVVYMDCIAAEFEGSVLRAQMPD